MGMGNIYSTGEVAAQVKCSRQHLLWLNSMAKLNVPRFGKRKLLAWEDRHVVTVRELLKRRHTTVTK
jgi:5-formaminoimidazole-4-carboxamide-1-beta-D-ribofuranosyl 5'-monophosphate synthetase